jgi:hypothetical protein
MLNLPSQAVILFCDLLIALGLLTPSLLGGPDLAAHHVHSNTDYDNHQNHTQPDHNDQDHLNIVRLFDSIVYRGWRWNFFAFAAFLLDSDCANRGEISHLLC